MPLTASSYEVTTAVYNVLQLNKATLGLAEVYYGRQEIIPEFPSVWVQAGPIERQLESPGQTHKWAIGFTVNIVLTHGKIQSSQENAREEEQLAEAIEAVMHEDLKLGGRVIFGMVTKREPGQVPQGETTQRYFVRAHLLTWEADSRQYF